MLSFTVGLYSLIVVTTLVVLCIARLCD